jgi:hypothetical protein
MSYPTGATIQAYSLQYSEASDDALLAMVERESRDILAKLGELLASARYLEARIRGTGICEPCSDDLSDRAEWLSCLVEELEHATAEAKRLAHGEEPKRARLIVRGTEVVGVGA